MKFYDVNAFFSGLYDNSLVFVYKKRGTYACFCERGMEEKHGYILY